MHCNNTNSASPLVSVIVVTYCQESTIARTLNSILAQQVTFAYEIVIGEDAGTDDTRAICEQYAKAHPDVVRLMPAAENKGVVRNYFDTLLSCRGEYIADCAGDDFWCDGHKLQKQVELLQQHPDATVVHTGWYRYDEVTGARTYAVRPLNDGDIVRSVILQTSFPVIHLCTALYRRNIVVSALADEPDLFLSPRYKCEDLQVAYILAKQGKVLYLPEPTLCYSVGHSSVSSEGDELKRYEFFLSATDQSHDLMCREQMTGKDVDHYFQSRIFALLMHLLRANRPDRYAELRQHIAQWPCAPSLLNRVLGLCLTCAPLRHTLRGLRFLVLKIKSLCR